MRKSAGGSDCNRCHQHFREGFRPFLGTDLPAMGRSPSSLSPSFTQRPSRSRSAVVMPLSCRLGMVRASTARTLDALGMALDALGPIKGNASRSGAECAIRGDRRMTTRAARDDNVTRGGERDRPTSHSGGAALTRKAATPNAATGPNATLRPAYLRPHGAVQRTPPPEGQE